MSENQRVFLKVIQSILGDDIVFIDDRIPDKARTDQSQSGKHRPMIWIRPKSVEDVATALRACDAYRISVVVQGGLTGLAGGANPGRHSAAISMELLSGIEEIDPAAATMTLLAGTPLERAQKAAEEAGFLLPIDLGSRGSCQIGGNLSTNAGGIRVLSHGVTRDNVLGLEAVLADGTVISSLNKMQKNNTGYDLKQLFIGSEGTLGVITRVVLKLKPLPHGRFTALCALQSYDDALGFLHMAQRKLAGLSAFEIMWDSYFHFSRKAEGLTFFDADYRFAVIIEQSGHEDGDSFGDFLGAALEEGLIADALIAQSEKEARAFWIVREGPAFDRLPGLINFDVSLPIGEIGAFATACEVEFQQRFADGHMSFYGHMADSNIHIAVSVGEASDALVHEIDTMVYQLVRKYRGSISAEHGIGTLKRDFLSYSRSPEEIDLMWRIKKALDPNFILNPGKVLPPA